MALLSAHTNNYAAHVNIAAKVFGEYGDFIHAVIRYKVRNEAQADDLFQDFFLSLVSKPPPPVLQNIKGYLYRAITNDIIDAARRMKRYESHLRKYGEQLNYTIKNDFENTLIEREELDKLFVLIKERLPESESRAIALRYRDSHSIKEVAEKMGVKKRTVSSYISVGLKKIRRFLMIKRGA